MNTITTYPVSGTRDFYPDNMVHRTWLFNTWGRISKLYGYLPYDAPVLEHTILYTRKGGDDITKEMYSFEKGGVQLSLRPEMTPSLVRMMMNVYKTETPPIKWYSIPQCWRYETTTKGRKREHYQWNVDSFGGPKIKTEAELLAMIVRFFKEMKLTSKDVVIKISDRRILQEYLGSRGYKDEKQIKIIFNTIDKLNKLKKDILISMLVECNMKEEDIKDLFALIEIKQIKDLGKYISPKLMDELITLFDYMDVYQLTPWIKLDLTVVRGLSYYTGVVFEAYFQNVMQTRSICGGGRYDNLMQKFGYCEQVNAAGFGMGDVVIMEGLQELGLLPKIKYKPKFCVIPLNKDMQYVAVRVSEQIRNAGIPNVLYEGKLRMKLAFGYADKIGAEYVIFIAPKEYRDGKIVLKDLRSGFKTNRTQKEISVPEFIKTFS